MYEMQADYPALYAELLAGTKPLDTMTANICHIYERPSAAEYTEKVRGKTRLEWRIKYAQDVMALMKKAPSTVPAGPVVVATGGAVGTVTAIHWACGPCLFGAGVAVGMALVALWFLWKHWKAPTTPISVAQPATAWDQYTALLAQRKEIDAQLAKLKPDVLKEANEAITLMKEM
jgi:hypothetical protein